MCFSRKNCVQGFKEFINNLPPEEEKDSIEFPLKKLIYIIKEKINDVKEGENIYYFDFSNEKMLPVKFNLNIKFQIKDEIDYSGKIDINELKRTNFNGFTIYIMIQDIKINYSSVYSTISHELKHVFDVYQNKPYMEPEIMKNLYVLMNKYNNKYLYEFLYLTYLSLTYEMEARNNEIYNKLRWLKLFDDQLILKEFKKTHIYNSLMELKNFDTNAVLNNVDKDDLIIFFKEYFRLIYNKEIVSDSKLLLNKIKLLFNAIADKYLEKSKQVLEELKRDNRPYMEAKKAVFYNELIYSLFIDVEISECLEDIFKEHFKF